MNNPWPLPGYDAWKLDGPPEGPEEDEAPKLVPTPMSGLERRARLLAAQKMLLVKDMLGLNLPAVLWEQMLPAAQRELDAEAACDREPF